MDAPATSLDEAAEERLLSGLRHGEATAFEELFARYGGRLLAAARRLLQNEEEARDAFQDGMVSAFRALNQFDGRSRLYTWLHRIVVNAALQRLRRRARRSTRSIDELLPAFLEDGHQVRGSRPWRQEADYALEQLETKELVHQAIQELPETYRTVLLLRDIEELDTQETAAVLGVTAAVVKTRLHRARQALRGLLDPHFTSGAL